MAKPSTSCCCAYCDFRVARQPAIPWLFSLLLFFSDVGLDLRIPESFELVIDSVLRFAVLLGFPKTQA